MPRPRKAKQIAYDNISALRIPRRTMKALKTIDAVKKAFALPVNNSGISDDVRESMNMAFDHAGGFGAIFGSLQQHAFEMGQYPLTSFVGYGALQQIAQSGMIRSCIQTVADDMTRKWIELKGDCDSEKLNHLSDILENKYQLSRVFNSAFSKCGYMGGSFVFIDTGADNLSLPLAINDMSAELMIDTTLKFIVVDPVNVSPMAYNCTNPLKDDYMQPHQWYVLGNQVHHSRMLSVVDNEPPTLLKPSYNFLGIPQAQILWDYVLHFNECRVSTAQLLRKISLLVVQTDMDAVLTDPNGVAQFDAKMDFLARYRDNDAVFVCDKDSEAVSNVQTSIAGCTDIVRQALEMIAAINRTPAVKLLGISPSGFNATGESDITNYYDFIHSKQETHRAEIQKCIEAVQLVEYGTIDPSITFDFVSLKAEDEQIKANTAMTKINALTALADRQAISADEVRQAVRQMPDIDLSFIDEEMPEMPDEVDEFKTDSLLGLENGETGQGN